MLLEILNSVIVYILVGIDFCDFMILDIFTGIKTYGVVNWYISIQKYMLHVYKSLWIFADRKICEH